MNVNRAKTACLFLKVILLSWSWSMTTGCTLITPSRTPAAQHANPAEALAAHNQLRARHHAPDLVWDNTLARYAERHASYCVFQHSRGKYGENLAAGYPTITAAVNAWYAERAHYAYNAPGFSSRTGHFTQLVWKSSQRLGCGYAVCNGRNGTPGKYWVCEYSPAGNVVNPGYFKANVLTRE